MEVNTIVSAWDGINKVWSDAVLLEIYSNNTFRVRFLHTNLKQRTTTIKEKIRITQFDRLLGYLGILSLGL